MQANVETSAQSSSNANLTAEVRPGKEILRFRRIKGMSSEKESREVTSEGFHVWINGVQLSFYSVGQEKVKLWVDRKFMRRVEVENNGYSAQVTVDGKEEA